MESIKKLIFNQGFPSYAQKKYDSFILMKFFPSKEYRDYFLSGKLYMRQHTEFAKKELGEGRADFTEGAEIVAIQRNSDKYLDIRFVQNDDGEVLVRFDELSENLQTIVSIKCLLAILLQINSGTSFACTHYG